MEYYFFWCCKEKGHEKMCGGTTIRFFKFVWYFQHQVLREFFFFSCGWGVFPRAIFI